VSEDAAKIRLIMELRQSGIKDTQVLSAIERVPREEFVLGTFVDQAYENTALPIQQGQTISQPYVVAFMTEVLELGTGSGYQAAVLSRLCRRVYTVERYRSLLRQAEQRFQRLGYHNITTRHGDGGLGWPEQAPFERILVTAAADGLPPALTDQLTIGGILIIPLGRGIMGQSVVRIRRTEDGFEQDDLLPVRFVPLVAGTAEAERG
jgi:protein-L-isoaspartate(D-aspartate) O-methyltransferase